MLDVSAHVGQRRAAVIKLIASLAKRATLAGVSLMSSTLFKSLRMKFNLAPVSLPTFSRKATSVLLIICRLVASNDEESELQYTRAGATGNLPKITNILTSCTSKSLFLWWGVT
jgi:hypothetical protein